MTETTLLYERAIRISPDAITISRLDDGVITDVNTAFLALTGFTRDEVIGHTAAALRLYSDPNDRAHMVRKVLHRGAVSAHEVPIRTKAGDVRRTSISAHVVGVDGTVHLFAAARDITDRSEAREELAWEVARLRKQNAGNERLIQRLIETHDADERRRLAETVVGSGAEHACCSPVDEASAN
ncbi:MAG: PAS domain S-box protein [Actinomycetota bacterium]